MFLFVALLESVGVPLSQAIGLQHHHASCILHFLQCHLRATLFQFCLRLCKGMNLLATLSKRRKECIVRIMDTSKCKRILSKVSSKVAD